MKNENIMKIEDLHYNRNIARKSFILYCVMLAICLLDIIINFFTKSNIKLNDVIIIALVLSLIDWTHSYYKFMETEIHRRHECKCNK